MKTYHGPPIERATQAALNSRMQEIAEAYEHLPPAKTAAFDRMLSQNGVQLPKKGFVTLDDVKSQLHGKSDVEIKAILRGLAERKYVDSVGGFSSDLITRRYKIKMNPELASEYQAPSAIVDYALRNRSLSPTDIRTQVARAIAAIRNSADLDPATAIHEAAQPVRHGSALYNYYCASGVWNATHEVYKAFCTGKL